MIFQAHGVTLADVHTERRLMGALLYEPGVLERCDEVDLDDLHDMRNQHVLTAVRTLQLEGQIQVRGAQSWVDVPDVMRCIQHEDVGREHHVLDQIGGLWFFVGLLLDFAPYNGERVLIDHDLAWLRTLATRRRAL